MDYSENPTPDPNNEIDATIETALHLVSAFVVVGAITEQQKADIIGQMNWWRNHPPE